MFLYPRYVPAETQREYKASRQIYFHLLKLCIFKTFPSSLSCYQYYALHMVQVDDIDILGWFLNVTLAGIHQWVFNIFPANEYSGKYSIRFF